MMNFFYSNLFSSNFLFILCATARIYHVEATSNDEDDSKVIWTHYDEKSDKSHILWIHADPEVVASTVSPSGLFNVSVLSLSSKNHAEYWALTGDYEKNKLFFTDYRSEEIGIRDLNSQKNSAELKGMMHGVESLAFDWTTQNLYCSDSRFNWIMVIDKRFRFYKPVYKLGDATPYALAIHTKHRNLYLSSYHLEHSELIVTDLAGGNARTLFTYPEVMDVTGLTIDYTDDRLYWTDFNGRGSLVCSSSLEGGDVITHAQKQRAIFWNVAAYKNFLYVTDVLKKRSDVTNEIYYDIWLIPKASNHSYRYSLPGKPRGITVMSKNHVLPRDNASSIGGCQSETLPPCEQLCLPRVDIIRECQCALGFRKKGDHQCETVDFKDDFLLVADEAQGRIFQIPFNYSAGGSQEYSIIKTSDTHSNKITNVAADWESGEIYWVDVNDFVLKKSSTNGSNQQVISNATYISYLEVDPCSKNVFFIEPSTQSIRLMDRMGRYETVLMERNHLTTSINLPQMLALDLFNRKIYWTSRKLQLEEGEVWRMNFDGSNKELVFTGLNWPRAITIDHKRGSLFICETKTVMVYEQPLEHLETIANVSHRSILHQYDVLAHLKARESFITDLKVHDDIVYIHNALEVHVLSFNLTTGPASLKSFGPSEFYNVMSLEIFSSSGRNLNCNTSLCRETDACRQLCVTVGSGALNTEKKCLCESGWEGEDCQTKTIFNFPPSSGGTCPDDMEFALSDCLESIDPPWKAPVWMDDNTPSDKLRIRHPPIKNLTRGRHDVIYTATDNRNLTSTCAFSVTITEVVCGELPTLPDNVTSSSLLCGHKSGSSFTVKCKEANETLLINGKQIDSLLSVCSGSGEWIGLENINNISCVDPDKKDLSDSTWDTTKQNKSTISQTVSSRAGAIVAITIAVFLLVVLLGFGVYLIRRRASLLNKINFPQFWRKSDDTVKIYQNRSTPTNIRFQVM